MSGAIPPLPNTPSWRGTQLKHRDKFTFTLQPILGLAKVQACKHLYNYFRNMFRPFSDHQAHINILYYRELQNYLHILIFTSQWIH
jgi:hypothetical protein